MFLIFLCISFMCVQIYQVSPSMLLPVMPHIMSDLTAKEDAKRLSALELLGKLYALPDFKIHNDFPELFKEFVRRSKDQQARLLALGSYSVMWTSVLKHSLGNLGRKAIC